MPQKISDIDVLREYLNGVMMRAEHHANGVSEVALALAGAVVWRKDSRDIEVLVREGQLGNVLWVWINGTRYAFSYNHMEDRIEMRAGSVQGPTLRTFSNSTPNGEIKNVFEHL
jgi:hypothetical protein